MTAEIVVRDLVESGQIVPDELIEIALSYLRNPTEPSKKDKIVILEMMGML
jgi:hypothetical protein